MRLLIFHIRPDSRSSKSLDWQTDERKRVMLNVPSLVKGCTTNEVNASSSPDGTLHRAELCDIFDDRPQGGLLSDKLTICLLIVSSSLPHPGNFMTALAQACMNILPPGVSLSSLLLPYVHKNTLLPDERNRV